MEIKSLIAEVESLENLGFDMTFLKDVKKSLGIKTDEEAAASNESSSVDQRLASNAQMIADLDTLQQRRLAAPAPMNLAEVRAVGEGEVQLAGKLTQALATDVGQLAVKPGDVTTPVAIHHALGLNDDDCDYDLLNEFLDINA